MEVCDSYGNDNSRNIEEVALWLGIIKTYVDEFYHGNKASGAWLFSKKYEKDFQYICDLANIEIGYMRRKIKERFRRERLARKQKLKKRAMIKHNKFSVRKEK